MYVHLCDDTAVLGESISHKMCVWLQLVGFLAKYKEHSEIWKYNYRLEQSLNSWK